MILRADIKYKSNWQQGALKAKRRNKWVCALKSSLAKVKMHGPSGDPGKSKPAMYTLVPYEEVKKEEEMNAAASTPTGHMREPTIPQAYTFTDERTVISKFFQFWNYLVHEGRCLIRSTADPSEDVFGEANEVQFPYSFS